MPSQPPFGKAPSMAVDFDAASEAYDFGDLAGVSTGDVDFTIESWVLFTTIAGWKEYMGKVGGGPFNGWYVFSTVNGGTDMALVFDDARVASLGLTQAANEWTYHCWVHNASANTVQGYYAQGVSPLVVGTLTSAIAGPTATTGAMQVGSQAAFPTDGGICRLAFVRVWSAALSEPQIRKVWNKRFRKPNAPFAGLTFLWDANFSATPIEQVTQTLGTAVGSPTPYFVGPPLNWLAQLRSWLVAPPTGGTTYNQSAGGTLTGSGALVKQTGKLLAGTLTGSGALAKQARKILAGTLTGSGALVKQTRNVLAGTLTGSGALVKQTRNVLAGTLTSAGSLVKQSRKVLAGTLTGSGALIKQTSKLLAGTLTGSGTLAGVRTFLKAIGGTLTGSGSLVKQTQKPLAGTLASAGTLLKQTRKALAGTLTGSGALSTVKVFLKAVGGTLTGSGTLSKQTQKTLAGSLSSAGSLTKRIAKLLGGTLSGSGALSALASGAASIIGRIRALFTSRAPGASFGSSTPGADLDGTTPGADIDTET